MPIRKNDDIRLTARAKRVALWQVAQELNVSEMTLYRWLRLDLTEEQHDRILNAIDTAFSKLYERPAE